MAAHNKKTELEQRDTIDRREVLGRLGSTLRWTALSSLLAGSGSGFYSPDLQGASLAVADPTGKGRRRSPKAKTIIHFFMNGGPSQVDLFDPKPALKLKREYVIPEDSGQGQRKLNQFLPSNPAEGQQANLDSGFVPLRQW